MTNSLPESAVPVSVDNLSFSYGAHRVLDGLSFTAREGEILAVLGANGAGKSTLFHCLLGFYNKEFTGEIMICGESVRKTPPKVLARRAAFVPQSHVPAFNYSVRDMVLMGTTAQINGLSAPGDEQLEAAQAAMSRLGIDRLASRGFTLISGGERQLTLIARAMAQNAKILIMDEPTANLDYGNQIRVMRRIRELAGEGYTVILSTHSPDLARRFAGRVLAVHDGTAAAIGAPEEALTTKLICKLYSLTPEELE